MIYLMAPTQWLQKMILYVMTYPAEHWCISFPSTFIVLGMLGPHKPPSSMPNLEDKEITQRLAIYCDQGSTAVTIHSLRHFSATSGRSTDFHQGGTRVGGERQKVLGAGRQSEHFESKTGFFPSVTSSQIMWPIL